MDNGYDNEPTRIDSAPHDYTPYDYTPPEAAPEAQLQAQPEEERKRSRFAAPLVIGAILGATLLGAGGFYALQALADDSPDTTTSRSGGQATADEGTGGGTVTDGGTVTGPGGTTEDGTRPEGGFKPGGRHGDDDRGAPPQDGQVTPGDDPAFDDPAFDDHDDPDDSDSDDDDSDDASTPSGGGTIVGTES